MKGFFNGFQMRRGRRLYADAAAATPIHPRARERMVRLMAAYGNPGSIHKEGVAARVELERARAEIAKAISALPDEIIFTGSGTEANNLALLGTLYPLLRKNTHLGAVALAIGHQSALEPLEHLKKYGLICSRISVDEGGVASLQELKELVTPQTALVSIEFVNSEVGTIQPLHEVAKFIRHARKERQAAGNPLPLLFHVDASQAPLYLPLNVEKLGADLMVLDGQKVLGPKSIGVLYRRRGVDIEPIMFGGGQERDMRPGTENIFLAGGFAEALTVAQSEVDERAAKVMRVRDYCLKALRLAMPDTKVNGTFATRIANNINISIPGLGGEAGVLALDAMGIAVATRSACGARDEEPSHVISALGASSTRAREAIRITFLPEVTEHDADRIVAALVAARKLYGT